jgi:hypothetical protein
MGSTPPVVDSYMMASMKSLTGFLAVVALTFSLHAQLTQPNANDWSPTSKRASEEAVARKLDEIRAAARRPPLERVSPSVSEVELVCTAANPNSTSEKPAYTVGIARRPSALMEFFAPLFSDVPFKGMNDWKKKVAPECRNRKGGY